jgi:DNA-binding CsgD family transcriptional regulator
MRLSRSDLEGVLVFLREAGELDSAEPFPMELLASLVSLVGCEGVTYAEIDRVNKAPLFFQSYLVGGDEPEGPGPDSYWATLHQHPIACHRALTGSLGAYKIYDFTTWRELRRTQFYADFLRPGFPPGECTGFLMSVRIPAPKGQTRTFNFALGRKTDFGERERTLLDLLQPHLLQLRRSIETRCRARATMQQVPHDLLSERETEVLLHVAEGMRNREIAHALWIAPGTVHKHLDNIYAKLGVHNRAAAAAHLHQNGSTGHP